MPSQPAPVDWRDARRRSARDAIVEAAWAVVTEAGLAGLSMRDLARRAGTTTPTLYAYFESKNEIYDAMFGQAAHQFAEHMAADYEGHDVAQVLAEGMRRFVGFCVADVPRYQLLFQRTIPGFEPSPTSYAPAVTALEATRRRLAEFGIAEARHLDMLTALLTGLVDQQVSNDPGGDRWSCLIGDFVEMFLSHCRPSTTNRRSQHGQRQKR
jgi:AcrR family transcriptional regulator